MYNDKMKSLTAKRLKELREGAKLTFEGLAKELTEKYGDILNVDGKQIISVGALKNYEVSEINHSKFKTGYGMNIQYLSIFADFYNVSTDYLLGRTDLKSADINDRAIQEITGLTEKAIDKLKSFKTDEDGSTYFSEYLSMLLENAYFVNFLYNAHQYVCARLYANNGYKKMTKDEKEKLHREISDLRRTLEERNLPVTIMQDYELVAFYSHAFTVDIGELVQDIYHAKKGALEISDLPDNRLRYVINDLKKVVSDLHSAKKKN